MVATTVDCNDGEVKVYDSIFSYLDKESLRTVMNLFSTENFKPKVKLLHSQKQKVQTTVECLLFVFLLPLLLA